MSASAQRASKRWVHMSASAHRGSKRWAHMSAYGQWGSNRWAQCPHLPRNFQKGGHVPKERSLKDLINIRDYDFLPAVSFYLHFSKL